MNSSCSAGSGMRSGSYGTAPARGPEGAVADYAADDAFPIDDMDDILPGLLERSDRVYYSMGAVDAFDGRLLGWMSRLQSNRQRGSAPDELIALDYHVHEMRLFKSRAEIRIMQRSAALAVAAHRRAMTVCRPGLREYELEAEFHHEFIRHGARCSYTPIVAAGANACVLHYTENRARLEAGELVLIDAGCEHRMYASDVTRTFPVNGRFSEPQRALYDIVHAANAAAVDKVRAGNAWNDPHDAAVREITRGLKDIGILKGRLADLIGKSAYRPYFMHKTGHWLGMDVHDVGDYKVAGEWRLLEPGMVMTIEPGIYIGPQADGVARHWRGDRHPAGRRRAPDPVGTRRADPRTALQRRGDRGVHGRGALNPAALDCDVLVVGGGLAGSTLAHALTQISVATVLIEERDPDRLEQPGFDNRATALANGSQRILRGLGLWSGVAAEAQPIVAIHISERGPLRGSAHRRRPGTRSGAGLYGGEPHTGRGYLAEAPGGRIRDLSGAGARLEALDVEDRGVTARVSAQGSSRTVRARLLVAADGARSRVREALGIGMRTHDYGQKAVIVNCRTELAHRGRAFERFTPSGPIAMLPLSRERMAVVWTLPSGAADRVIGLDDAAFRGALQRAFGYRLGGIGHVGKRTAWPLYRVLSDSATANRTVLVGNAALSLHPVAGQSFNLALRDIAALAEAVCDARRTDSVADPGAAALLDGYRRSRTADQRRIAGFTHGLVRLFGREAAPLAVTRGLGLMAFDLIPGAKAWLARQAMGLGGRVPRLARGLRLTP